MGHYRLGPLGRMIVVDVPPGGFNDELVRLGVTHVSLNGTSTQDVFGYKKRWSIPLVGLAPMALSWIEMCYLDAVGPLYFLDEERTNRLSPAASSTLSAWAPRPAFTASEGASVVNTTITGVPTHLSTTVGTEVTNTLAPRYALRWTPTAAGTAQASDHLVPVVAGEHLCFSVYLLDGVCTIELVPYGPTLAPLAPVVGGADQAENVTRRYLPYTVPSDGSVVAVRAQLRAAAADTVDTIGWQLEQGDLPTPWVIGVAPARVLASLASESRRHYGDHVDSTLILTEA